MSEAPTVGEPQLTPIETIEYWANAYSNPASGEHFQGHGTVVCLLLEYANIRRRALATLPVVPPSQTFTLDEVQTLTDYLTESTAKAMRRPADEDRANAARYRWLRAHLHGADFMYGEAPDEISVITFRWPPNVGISSDLDACIDDAMRSAPTASGNHE